MHAADGVRGARLWWRWSGRLLGGLATFWWVIAVVGGVLAGPDLAGDGGAGSDLEGIGVVALVAANALAYVHALVREDRGAVLLVVTGAAFCGFAFATAGRNHLVAAAVSGVPFLLSGVLLLVAARQDPGGRRTRRDGIREGGDHGTGGMA